MTTQSNTNNATKLTTLHIMTPIIVLYRVLLYIIVLYTAVLRPMLRYVAVIWWLDASSVRYLWRFYSFTGYAE